MIRQPRGGAARNYPETPMHMLQPCGMDSCLLLEAQQTTSTLLLSYTAMTFELTVGRPDPQCNLHDVITRQSPLKIESTSWEGLLVLLQLAMWNILIFILTRGVRVFHCLNP